MNTGNQPETVSVVIGAYNAAAWIGETLDSVLAQTYPILEVLVVDDGSTDSTAEIVTSYGGKVKYLQEAHRGRPHRNRGILAAQGEFVAFIDADDYWHPRKIELQMALLLSRRVAWAICEAQWLDSGTGRPIRSRTADVEEGDILERLFLRNFIVSATPVVAKYVFAQVGYFNEGPAVRVVEDWDLWLRIAARFPVACVRQRLATLRLHADSFLASTPEAEKVRSLESVIAQAVSREPSRLGRLRRRSLANVYYAAGVQLTRRDQFREARRYFLRTLQQRVTHIEAIGYILLTLLGPALAGSILRWKRRFSNGIRPLAP